MSALSLLELAELLTLQGAEMVGTVAAAMLEAGEEVKVEAKKMIGHQHPAAMGPFEGWKPLAQRTRLERVALGFSANRPLLRTGEMRDSLEVRLIDAMEVEVGSDLDKALWQERGTKGPNAGPSGYHIPPRSFLGAAAWMKEDRIVDILGVHIESLLVGGNVPNVRIR